jgi:hypothetical protein
MQRKKHYKVILLLNNCIRKSAFMFSVVRGRRHKRYNFIVITLHYVFVLLHNALYLWIIVIALDFSRALLFLIVPALSLQVSVVASLRYRFEQLTQALSLVGK